MNEQLIRNPNVPRIVFMIWFPIQIFMLGTFFFYLAFHWHDFIGQSAHLIAWIGWFISLVLYGLLAWLFIRVIQSGVEFLIAAGHGAADVHRKFTETRLARAKIELLETHDNYVVYKQDGRVVVQAIIGGQMSQYVGPAAPEIEGSTVEALPSPEKTFRELLDEGVIDAAIRQGRMILGYVNGTLRYGTWMDLYSCGIGGVSGSGKSTTVRFLLFQAVIGQGRLIMVDPHIGEPQESLAAQFKAFKNIHILPPCDDNTSAVLKRIRWLKKEYKRRETHGIKGPAIIFVLDEFNAIVRRLTDEVRKELADLLLDIAQGGRKFGLFAMLIGQRWSEQDLGGKNYGAAIRSSLASLLAHRFTDEDQAKKLIGGRHGSKCLELPQGHYFFRDTGGTLSEMVTPLTVMEDGAYIQQRLDAENTGETTPETTENTEPGILSLVPLGNTEPLKLVDFRAETTPEIANVQVLALRIIQMQAEGANKSEIVRTIWGVNPGASDGYKQANEAYLRAMKYIAEHLGA